MEKENNGFELEIDRKTYIVTLHYPSNSEVKFSDILLKLMKDDARKAVKCD